MSKFLQSNILSLVLLAALMGFATTWQAEAKRAASMGPTVVATVNLNTVMDGLAERADLQAELAIEAQSIQAEQQQRTDELERLSNELEEIVDEGRRTEMQDQFDLRMLQQMAWLRFTQQEIDVNKSLMMENIFRNMQKAAMELAQIEGIDLVLIEDSTMGFQVLANSQISREQQMAEQIASRRVLWRESTIDISDELIIRMNNDYAASTGGR